MQKLNLFINNQYVESKATSYYDIYNPSTGEVIAQAPKCTDEEIEMVQLSLIIDFLKGNNLLKAVICPK